MDGADDDYCGPPGRLPYSDSGSSQRHRLSYSAAYSSNAAGGGQPPSRRANPRLHGLHQIAASLDPQELDLAYMQGQFMQHELQMRRRFIQEQHEQLFSHLLHSSNNPSNASTGGSPLLRAQPPTQQNPTSPGGSVQLPSSHHYAGADFGLSTSAGRRILQEEQAFLRAAQQQELLRIRMMRTQVNSNNQNNINSNPSAADQHKRFLELTSQMHHGNRSRASSVASPNNENNTIMSKIKKRSNSTAVHNTIVGEMKKRKRTESFTTSLLSNKGKRDLSQELSKRKRSFSDTKELKKTISKTIQITEILDDDDDNEDRNNFGKKNKLPQSIEVIDLEGTEEEDSTTNSNEKVDSDTTAQAGYQMRREVQNQKNKKDDQNTNEIKRDESRKDNQKVETKNGELKKNEKAKEPTQVQTTVPNNEIESKKGSQNKETNDANNRQRETPDTGQKNNTSKTVPEDEFKKKLADENDDNIISKEEFEGNMVDSKTPSSPPKRDISLLLLASEEVDLKAMDYELTLVDEEPLPPVMTKVDGLKLLDAASKSIEESSLNENNKQDDDEEGVSVIDNVDRNDSSANIDTKLPEKLNSTAIIKKDDSQVDDNDSVQYIVKPICPGFMFKLPTLPCEAEYDETIIKKIKNKSKNDRDGSRLSLSSKSQDKDTHKDSEQKLSSQMDSVLNEEEDTNVDEPVEIPVNKEKSKKTIVYKAPVDTWWPSNNTIRRERRLQGYRSDEDEDEEKSVKIASLPSLPPSMHERLSNHIEPGILEKLPHCKIHQARVELQKNHPNPGPLFCSQVTEAYCTEVMLCCSICHTWRHAACGGHYTKYKPHTSKDSNNSFKPICDRCHAEKRILENFPQGQVRIRKQRIENLRRALSTTSVVRHFSFAKHGGTYKWPLGSVSATHIGGHTRSVHARHERSEKQWSELAMKLGNGLGYRPKERVKVRTRELERLIVSIEDAEGETDRHNMMLFLQNDVAKENPVGFKKTCCSRNFFDPAEDVNDFGEPWHVSSKEKSISNDFQITDASKTNGALEEKLGKVKEKYKTNDDDSKSINSLITSCDSENSNITSPKIDNGSDDESSNKIMGSDESCAPSLEEDEDNVSEESTTLEKQTMESQKMPTKVGKERKVINAASNSMSCFLHEGEECKKIECARHGCRRSPRFDSIFCSDSCGVSALELDLLRSFEYASDIHPSLLRA